VRRWEAKEIEVGMMRRCVDEKLRSLKDRSGEGGKVGCGVKEGD
jgi:hypothetical protein